MSFHNESDNALYETYKNIDVLVEKYTKELTYGFNNLNLNDQTNPTVKWINEKIKNYKNKLIESINNDI